MPDQRMSQIAQALAKAKERTGQTTAPFLVPGAAIPAIEAERAAASAAAIRSAKIRQRFWGAIIAVALPLTAFVVWTQFRSASKPGSDSGRAPSGETAGEGTAHGAAAHTTTTGAQTKHGGEAPGAGAQRLEVIQQVNSLAISAVMPGDPPRIMLAGRVVRAGQLIEGAGGLTFTGIADGALRFTDSNGVVYTRYY